jgi:autotransporter-associated beta strand protein
MKSRPNPFIRSATLSISAAIVLSATATAAVLQWDGGAATSNWQTAANWNPDALNTAYNGTFANRLNVNGAQKLVYTSAEGTTNYTGDTVTGGGRGLTVGNTSSGTMEISGGTFSTLGAIGADIIGNGNNSTGILTINGGTFIGTNVGTSLGIGTGTGRVSTLNVSSGLATIANLNLNSSNATVNLSGTGILEINNLSMTAGSTGRINFDGGTLRARTNTANFITGLTAATINGGGATINSNDKAITIAQSLVAGTGSGGLTKTGLGTLTLSSSGNTYIGATQITGGTLSLTGSGAINTSNGITINGSGAKFLHTGATAVSSAVTLTQGTLTGSGTVNTVNVGAGTGGIISNNDGVAGSALTIGALTLSGGANINLFSSTTAAPLLVTTLTNNSLANAVTITANNTGGWTNGSTYNLINYTTLGGTGGNNFARSVNNLSARQSATWGDSGSAITLAIAGDTPYWTGATNGKWNGTDGNWKLVTAGTDTTFLASDDVLFDDNATGTTSIDIDAANVAPTTTVFNNTTAKSYTLGSTGGFGISAGSLTKNNSGALTINNANTHSGGTTLNGGTLNVGNAGALGGVGNLFTINGGTLDNTSGGALTTNNQVLSLNGSFAFTGTDDLNLGTGAATLGTAAGTSRTITVNGGKLTLANGIANGTSANSITKDGTGTLELTGTNSLSGPITINGGTVQISGGSAIVNAGLVTLGDVAGATFKVSGSETIGALSGGGTTGGNVTLDPGQTLTLSSGTQSYAGTITGSGVLTSSGAVQTLNGAISSSGGVNVTSGRLLLGGNNSYTGQTSVSAGAGIVITANNALGAGGTGNETLLGGLGGGLVSGAIGLSGGVNYSTNEKIVGAGVGNTSANGEFASVQRGLVQSISGNNTFAGNIEINATGITRLGTQNGSQLTLSGTITAVSGASILIRAGDSNGDFVTLSGSGNSWEGDVSIFTGNITAAQAAGLRLGANDAIPTTSSVIGSTSSGAANTFDMAGYNQTLNGLGSGSTLRITNSSSLQQSTLTLNTATLSRGAAATTIVDGAGTIRLVKQGSFTQTFSGNNNYSGTTTIEAGRILFGQVLSLYNGNSASWTKENIIVNSGATLGLRVGGSGEFTAANVASIVGNLTTGINNNGLRGGSLLGLEVNATTTYSTLLADSTGTGSGSLGLVKTGTSDLTLDQNNTFSGGVALNDGFLYAGHNNAFGTGTVTINTGADRLAVKNGIDISNDIVIDGGGTSFNGLIQNFNAAGGENATVSGDITINSSASAGGHFASVGSGSTLTLTGSINATVEVTQRTGTVIYSGGGSYSNISVTGTARLGANNGLATNATADLGLSGNSVLDLAGYNQSLVGIVKNAANGASSATVGNSSTVTDSTLTVTGTSIYGGVIQDVVGFGNRKVHLTMNGAAQTFSLSNANTYTGDTTITAGTLALTGTGSIANSANLVVNGTLDVSGITASTFAVGASQTLSGDGTIDATSKTLSIEGRHNAGGLTTAGSQAITGDLNYADGSIFDWNLNASDTLSGFDTVSTTGTMTVGANTIFNVILGGSALTDLADPENAFWNTANSTKVWNMSDIFGSAFASNTFASVTSTANPTTQGAFTITGGGSTLTWTAVPEPTSALAGLLIGAGLLRRRRQN